MTGAARGFDLAVGVVAAFAWGFAAWVFGSQLISPTAGGLLGLALFFSSLAMALSGHLQDVRMNRLLAGVCPRCRGLVQTEHTHRRWDNIGGRWLPAMTSWDCDACGFNHAEAWVCPACQSAPA